MDRFIAVPPEMYIPKRRKMLKTQKPSRHLLVFSTFHRIWKGPVFHRVSFIISEKLPQMQLPNPLQPGMGIDKVNPLFLWATMYLPFPQISCD